MSNRSTKLHTPMAQPSTKSRQRLPPTGNSLIELVIVLLVLAIMTSVAAPRFGDALDSHRLKAGVNHLARDLEMARELSRTTGRDITVTFDSAAGRYSISPFLYTDRQLQTYTVSLSGYPYYCQMSEVSFPGGLGGEYALVFNRFQEPDGQGSLLVGRSGTTQRVQVSITGKVTTPVQQ